MAWHGTLDVGGETSLRLIPGSYTLVSDSGEERTVTIAADALRIDV